MGSLSTHVLDTMNGCPAAGMAVALFRFAADDAEPGAAPQLLRRFELNADGRAGAPLLQPGSFEVGRYRLVFDVAAYFRARGIALPEPPFIDQVTLDFGLAESIHYHVPLLASPWAYSTYRGS